MSARPHHVGSPGDKAVVDYIYNKFKSWGYDAQVETFYVPFPTPKERLLEMTEPTTFRASLAEKPLKEDATSGQTSGTAAHLQLLLARRGRHRRSCLRELWHSR